MDKIKEMEMIRHALFDYEQEINYCENVLKDEKTTEETKTAARGRLKRAKEQVKKIKNALAK